MSTRNKKLSYDWDTIRTEYVTSGNEVTIQSLADKYGASRFTVMRHCNSEDWPGQRVQFRDEVSRKTLNKVSTQQAEIRARQFKIINAAYKPVLIRLQTLDPLELSARELRCYLKDLMYAERAAAGIAEEHNVRFTRDELDSMTDEQLSEIAYGKKQNKK